MNEKIERVSYTAFKDDSGKLLVEYKTEIAFSYFAAPYERKVGVLKYKPKKKKKK